MKRLIAGLVLGTSLLFPSVSAFAATYVHGYTKSNGTYVQGYYRSSPNSTVTDNYSYIGNTNPYTGAVGTNYYTNSPSSPYYSPSLPSYTPVLNSPSYSYTNDSPSSEDNKAFIDSLLKSFNIGSTPQTKTLPTKTITVSSMAKKWADTYPFEDCSKAPLTQADKNGCAKYRSSVDDLNEKVDIDYTIDPVYTSCDGGANYYLLNSDGSSYECPAEAPTAPVTADSAQQELINEINSLLTTIASLQAQIAALASSTQQ